VAANNHYDGFGPSTANTFRKINGLQEVYWQDRNAAALRQQKISDYRTDSKQTSLSDFSE
jgi:hypothetical protein